MNGCLQLTIIAALMVAAILVGAVSPNLTDAAISSGEFILSIIPTDGRTECSFR